MKTFGALLLSAMLLTTACKSSKQLESNPNSVITVIDLNPMLQGQWALEEVNGEEITLGADEAFLNFDCVEHHFFGKGGCNSFNGPLTLEVDQLSIGMLMATKKYCPGNTLEAKLMKLLTNSKWTVAIEDDQLTLSNESNRMLLKKQK